MNSLGKKGKNDFGQSVLEYAIILAVVVAAFSAMQFYMKRGIQAATKLAVDQLGSQDVPEVSSEDAGGHLMSSSDSSQSRDYRYVKTGLILSPRLDRQTSYNEATVSTGTSTYNAGEYSN